MIIGGTLDNIKAAFFDFDDTLVITRRRFTAFPGDKESLTNLFQAKEPEEVNLYNEAIVPHGMLDFVTNMKRYVKGCYCIADGVCSQWYTVKKSLTDKYYARLFDEVLIAGRPEDKITIMEAYAEVNKLRPREILFIDDNMDSLKLAHDAGFTVVSAMEVLACYTENLATRLAKGK